MNDILSQEEIDALFKSYSSSSKKLSKEEIDVLGEIGNISFGTSATALYAILRHKVTITTPKVEILDWEQLRARYPIPYVGVLIKYTEGLNGSNLLVLKEDDVKIITDLMMGGDGKNLVSELGELHLSAIGEVMNQMIGAASTSLSTILNKKINISPPKAFIVDFTTSLPQDLYLPNEDIVVIGFKMEVEGVLNSEIMQIMPIDFAKNLVQNLLNSLNTSSDELDNNSTLAQGKINQDIEYEEQKRTIDKEKREANVFRVQFEQFKEPDEPIKITDKNIGIIMDVELEVSVELGRTKRLIKDILEFGPGSIIELDKLAGEPVDILVNGKHIAKGEVVVIDENFGVRITEIVQPLKRVANIK